MTEQSTEQDADPADDAELDDLRAEVEHLEARQRALLAVLETAVGHQSKRARRATNQTATEQRLDFAAVDEEMAEHRRPARTSDGSPIRTGARSERPKAPVPQPCRKPCGEAVGQRTTDEVGGRGERALTAERRDERDCVANVHI
jgi:hypothetical protein